MSFRLGLTGSIGMGKSTTAQMFAEEGCAVWDADAAVHRLYAPGGKAVPAVKVAFPEAVPRDTVDRDALRAIVTGDPAQLQRLEAIVHPLVAEDRAAFLAAATAEIVVFDIPLLFETGGEREMDATVCVTVSAEIQRQRLHARRSMTPRQIDAILSKQMPDAEKRARADFVITADTVEHARQQVKDVIQAIRTRMHNA